MIEIVYNSLNMNMLWTALHDGCLKLNLNAWHGFFKISWYEFVCYSWIVSWLTSNVYVCLFSLEWCELSMMMMIVFCMILFRLDWASMMFMFYEFDALYMCIWWNLYLQVVLVMYRFWTGLVWSLGGANMKLNMVQGMTWRLWTHEENIVKRWWMKMKKTWRPEEK